LASNPQIDLEVIYCHNATPQEQADAGFSIEFNWDISLLDGYPNRFLKNVATRASLHSFAGLDTPEIREIIDRERFDAVMINGWHYKSAWQTIFACWRSGTALMGRGDSHLHTPRVLLKRTLKWPLYRSFIPRLNACLAVGKWSKEYFLHYGAKPERIFFVPHAVDDGLFNANSAKQSREEVRRTFGIDPAAVVYLFVGKFIRVKRPIDFVKSIGDAARTNRRLTGLMVGDGPMRQECEEFALRNRIPIRLVGFLNQSKIASAYAAADALVVPSEGETWGVTVNEAMACGLPSFVSDKVGSGPDLIADGKTGACFPVGNREALSALLSEYTANPDKLSCMREGARRKASEYSIPVAVEGVLRALEAVS
jgi:glycosyltransferase involved in cell wall biosynthesis